MADSLVPFLFSSLSADVNAFDNFQWTPLHHCAHAGEVRYSFAMLILLVFIRSALHITHLFYVGTSKVSEEFYKWGLSLRVRRENLINVHDYLC